MSRHLSFLRPKTSRYMIPVWLHRLLQNHTCCLLAVSLQTEQIRKSIVGGSLSDTSLVFMHLSANTSAFLFLSLLFLICLIKSSHQVVTEGLCPLQPDPFILLIFEMISYLKYSRFWTAWLLLSRKDEDWINITEQACHEFEAKAAIHSIASPSSSIGIGLFVAGFA